MNPLWNTSFVTVCGVIAPSRSSQGRVTSPDACNIPKAIHSKTTAWLWRLIDRKTCGTPAFDIASSIENE